MDDDGLKALAEKWIDTWGGNEINGVEAILGAVKELSAAHEKELAEWKVRSIYFQREEDQLRARLDDAERLLRQYAAHEPQVFTFLTPSTPAPPVEPQEAAKPFEKGAGEYGTKISDAALAPDPLAPVLARLDELDGFARAKAVSDGEVTRQLAGLWARVRGIEQAVTRRTQWYAPSAPPEVAGSHAFVPCKEPPGHCWHSDNGTCTKGDCGMPPNHPIHVIPSKPEGK